MWKLLILIVLFSFTRSFSAQNYNALFIGNSYTSVNNLPSITALLANSLDDTLTYESNTPGGYTLQGHSGNSTTLNKISQTNWDFVILQEQSQRPSFPPSQVATEVYPFATKLVDSIRAANVCTTPLFYMTWGRKNGDQQNCQYYTPLCTYNGMQDRLRASYLQMTTDNNSSVSPVGAAWKYTRDNYANINLYSSDGSHPSLEGSYLAACVFYSSMYRKSPEGATYTAGLSSSIANTLQEVARLIVIDSLDFWNIGINDVVVENITYTNVDNNYQFAVENSNGTNFNWSFGNGTNSTNEAPSATYLTNGNYEVTLNANNGCTSDTTSTVIMVNWNSIAEDEITFVLKKNKHFLQLEFDDYKSRKITLFDLNGKLIYNKKQQGKSLDLDTTALPSVFLILVEEGNKTQSIKVAK